MTDLSALESLFFALLEKPEAERAEFLDRACRDNVHLRAEVERLLAAHLQAAAFLESPPRGDLPSTGPFLSSPSALKQNPAQPDAGAILAGKYKLLEEIGEGGMGSVWMAQQSGPIKRLVAVKVIKAGMDSKAVVARFDVERQALALMDHPNIARVFDAGATPDGRPFFVMELVKGTPITQFCDQRRLTPRERLQLFVPVCQAIQHAHQKGVIHRDIKPQNVLVALYDDLPVPKVIDFGVAKAMSQPLTEQTLATGFGAVVGTPEYMSPEQATFNNLDIDTRSDVFALGILIYELLTGSPPISRQQLQKIGLLEVLRVVREVEPPRPSTRLSTAETLPRLAANRSTEPRKLTGLMRNELDWIVMKALEKDRRRRYDSASSMALDVLRYLSGEPVQAVPPSLGYRLQKFANKHRSAMIATGALTGALGLGLGGTMWGMLSAEKARTGQADQSRIAQEQEAARLRVEAELAAKQHAEQLQELRNRDAALNSLIQVENALRACDGRHASEAFEEAQWRLADKGVEELRARFERCRSDLAMLNELDRIDNDIWTKVDGKVFTWEAIFPRWARAFAGYGIGPDYLTHENAALIIKTSFIHDRLLTSLELWYIADGHKPELREILSAADPDEFRTKCRTIGYQQAVLSRAFRCEPLPSVQPVWFAVGLGSDLTVDRGIRDRLLRSAYQAKPNSFPLLMTLGQLDDVNDTESGPRRASWYRAAVAIYPTSAPAWNNLGLALRDANDLAGAIAALKEAVRLNPGSSETLNNLGIALRDQRDFSQSIECFQKAIRLQPTLALAHCNLALLLNDTGDHSGAIAACQQALRLDPNLALAHQNLGFAHAGLGDYRAALKYYKTALQLNPHSPHLHNLLANCLCSLGDYSGAIPHYEEAIRLNPKNGEAYNNLGMTLQALRNTPGAIAAFQEAVRLNPRNALMHTNLGIALAESGQFAKAMSEHQEAIRLDPKLTSAYTNLGSIHIKFKEYARAIDLARKAIRLDETFSNAHAMLGFALQQTGDVPGARIALTEAARLNPKQWGPLLAKLPPLAPAPPPRMVR